MRYRRPHRIKKKKLIFSSRFFWLSTLTFTFITFLIYFLFFSQFFQVKKIIVTGDAKVSKENIKALVEDNLNIKILFFSTKSIFAVNFHNRIKENLTSSLLQVATVEIHKSFPETLNIIVVERLGLAIFCQNINQSDEISSEECFLIDQEGIAFEEVLRDNYQLPKLKISNFNKLELGGNIVEGDLLFKILEIFSKLNEIKISTRELLIISEERINVIILDGWEIYFNPKRDLDWQLKKLRAVLQEYIPLEKREDLEYIELRFGDLAPFKYQTE